MPFASLLQAVDSRVKIMGLPQEPISSLLTFWGGVEQGFWAFDHGPAVFVKKIHCPVLLQWGAHDGRVSKEEIDEIYNNIPSEKKLVIYESAAHQSLYLKEPTKWETQVRGFLSN